MSTTNFGSKRTWTARNLFMCYLVSMAQLGMGYPGAIIASTLAQPSFLEYMGLLDLKANPPGLTRDANSLIGAISGLFQAGAAINVFLTCYVADKWGRKAAFHYCAVWSVLGGGLLCGSRNLGMFLVGRFFAGGGSYGYLVSTPFYVAELAPPGLRGLMVGLNGFNLGIAYALANFMGLAFYFVDSPSAKWRGPLAIALVWPVLTSIVCFFVPESPRYLLMQGRVAEARDVIYKLHASKHDPDQEYVRGEFYQMSKQAELERQLSKSYLQMVRSPHMRKRFFLTLGYAFFSQSTGILVLINYGPTIFKALGYDTLKQIIFQCGFQMVGVLGNILGALLIDWVGRKPLMLIGLTGCCVTLILEAAMVASFAEAGTNHAGLKMGVAAIYIFLLFYTVSFDSAGLVFFSEVFPNHLRAQGLAVVISFIALVDLIYIEVTAKAFATIGWKFYLVFIILSGIGVVWTWIYIIETKQIPLEEMGTLFGDEVAVHAADVHVDHNTHELIIEEHNANDSNLARVASEIGVEKQVTDVSNVEDSKPTAQHVGHSKTDE